MAAISPVKSRHLFFRSRLAAAATRQTLVVRDLQSRLPEKVRWKAPAKFLITQPKAREVVRAFTSRITPKILGSTKKGSR